MHSVPEGSCSAADLLCSAWLATVWDKSER